MAIKRYVAIADTTITNCFKPNLIDRATGSNTGEADTMEIFHIYAQSSVSSSEKSRILVQFPVNSIVQDRSNEFIPASGNVEFRLRLFNAKHPLTLPRKYNLTVQAISSSWAEGAGLDLDEHSDDGYANWEIASSGASGVANWTTEGGDYHGSPTFNAYFDRGYEDMDLDITTLVEEWIAGDKENYGVGVRLSGDAESALSSSYTKRFFARGSEFFYWRPIVEARWDSSIKDDRASFWASSSLASAEDNLNTVYLYNFVRGQLKNIPGVNTGEIYVQAWSDAVSGSLLTTTPITGGHVSTGVYSASFALDIPSSCVYDRWYGSSLTPCYHTGSIEVKSLRGSNINSNPRYVITIPNFKHSYSTDEIARFRLFTRQKNWCPNVYTKMIQEPETEIIDDIYYKVERVTDKLKVIEYGTGSMNHTRLSYDVSGSYFDLDMSLFEPGFAYEMSFIFAVNDNYREQEETFKFRVD